MTKNPQETDRKFIPYNDQLKDPRWRRKAEQVKNRDNFICQKCGSDSLTLTAHHLFYIPNCYAWEYSNDCLTTLCDSCHSQVHEIENGATYSPCKCTKCKQPIVNANCSTVARLGDYFRFDIYCDKCSGVNNVKKTQ